MLAHRAGWFGPHESTEPWIYTGILIVLGVIAAVHIYRSVRKRRARDKARAAAAGIKGRPVLPFDACGQATCPILPEMHPGKCSAEGRRLCRRDFPELHPSKEDV